jgi:hypothetical protein
MSSAAVVERRSGSFSLWDGFDAEEEDYAERSVPLDRIRSDEASSVPPSVEQPASLDELRTEFELLAAELSDAARALSSTRRAINHPAYGEILSMGTSAIPLLLDRLRHDGNRPLWLRLLGSLTTLQPGAGRETIEEAAEAWLTWAKRDGLRV